MKKIVSALLGFALLSLAVVFSLPADRAMAAGDANTIVIDGSTTVGPIAKAFAELPRQDIMRPAIKNNSAVLVADSMEEAIAFTNDYAAEHLEIVTADPIAMLPRIQHAGSIFLGHYSPVAVGDYLAGPNHVLPTGGSARFFSPLGVEDFLKRTSVIRFEAPKLRELGQDVMRLAEMEGLTGHKRSVDLRLQKIRRARREREAARETEAELKL